MRCPPPLSGHPLTRSHALSQTLAMKHGIHVALVLASLLATTNLSTAQC